MTHTMTVEKTFEGVCDHGSLSIAVQTAVTRMQNAAEKAGYTHDISSTFKIMVVRKDRGDEQRVLAEASSVYAKIVPAPQEEMPDEAPAPGVIDSVPENPFS